MVSQLLLPASAPSLGFGTTSVVHAWFSGVLLVIAPLFCVQVHVCLCPLVDWTKIGIMYVVGSRSYLWLVISIGSCYGGDDGSVLPLFGVFCTLDALWDLRFMFLLVESHLWPFFWGVE
ncbi:hypothetical protein V6N12_050988 [Hibiscus sabdariffa]|uniref:Uncharacterized protein n=1 Tax=Hibiscus sabdariffa TaxID=183260 RepID=A0ABR2GE07_9ROSI